jgi:hypothetical protein
MLRELELEVWSFSGAWRLVLGASFQVQLSSQTPPSFHDSTENSEEPK